jgi:hypothetical protein
METEASNSVRKIMEGNDDKQFAIYKDYQGNCYVKFEDSEEKKIQKYEYDELERYKNRMFDQKIKA